MPRTAYGIDYDLIASSTTPNLQPACFAIIQQSLANFLHHRH
jgi:hypothetical protein